MVAHLKSLRRPADLGCHPKPLMSAVVAYLDIYFIGIWFVWKNTTSRNFNNMAQEDTDPSRDALGYDCLDVF